MRQRKPKDLEKRLQERSRYIVDIDDGKTWRERFGNDAPLFLEIGCGKGSFIIKKADMEKSCNFIAVEGQDTVILRALEKTDEAEPDNLLFILSYIDNMADFFEDSQLDGIYLNFSDPWPKARHAKRRLTYRRRLMDYAKAVKDGGFIEIKTDNDALYDFTLEEAAACRLEIIEATRDLHNSRFDSRHITTEYEQRFMNAGKNINYVKIGITK